MHTLVMLAPKETPVPFLFWAFVIIVICILLVLLADYWTKPPWKG